MTKFEKRNSVYAEMSKIADNDTQFHYIDGVLYLCEPVRDQKFIETQERMFEAFEKEV